MDFNNIQVLWVQIPIFLTNHFMLTISINFILKLTCIVFFIGLLGIVLNRKNILIIIMSIELLFSIVYFNFCQISILFDLTIFLNKSLRDANNTGEQYA